MFRAFVALDLPEPLLPPLLRLQEQLDAGRAVPQDNLHLTLCFLGDQPGPVLEELHHALSDLQRGAAPVLRLSGLMILGGRRARVVAAGVERQSALFRLQQAVRRAAEAAGIALRRERFRPHVTLARFGTGLAPEDAPRLGRFLAAHGDFSAGPEAAESFTLYRSLLRPDGAVHDPLARYDFAPQDP